MHRTACIKILSSFVSGKIAVQQCKGKKTIAIECSELFVVSTMGLYLQLNEEHQNCK